MIAVVAYCSCVFYDCVAVRDAADCRSSREATGREVEIACFKISESDGCCGCGFLDRSQLSTKGLFECWAILEGLFAGIIPMLNRSISFFTRCVLIITGGTLEYARGSQTGACAACIGGSARWPQGSNAAQGQLEEVATNNPGLPDPIRRVCDVGCIPK